MELVNDCNFKIVSMVVASPVLSWERKLQESFPEDMIDGRQQSSDAAPAAVSSAAPAVAPAAASSLELSIGSVRTLSSPIVHATQDEPSEKRKKLNGTSSPPEPPTRDFPIFRFSFKGACCIDALLSPSRLRFRRCSLLLSSSVHPLPSSRLLFLPPVDFLATHRVSTFSEVSHISPHFRQSW